ncbi:MAG: chromosome segregation protein SMC [Candidatus Abyssobacteria bacterium SURF_5]|uniref:Chromosome segregation protein SMC n=1 Tax=Abyssobacteria bacterium (strain SURF_5) TaxID=2093360 RepID=A0A3A4P0Z8_ABYX5|nr:MAG: chromosome segregation protein SMC [Candidatus Abyssubacteria bacterium SURF_5]
MGTPKNKVLRFTRITIANWRNFSRVEVELQRRVLLIGANALGKSNFLDVFRFLHDVVSVGGGFQEAVRRRRGIASLRSLSAQRPSDIMIKAHIGTGDEPSLWEYDLSLNQDRTRGPIVRQEKVSRNGKNILIRPNQKDRSDPQRLTQTYLEQVHANEPFREVADFFASIHYLHIVPQLMREPERISGREESLGSDFLEQIARVPKSIRDARLRKIVDAMHVAVPQLKQLELWRDEQGRPHLRGRYEHWRSQAAWQTEEQFSDGTLRLLGLLWAMLDGTGPLLMEEPELSLHPEVVRLIPQMFARVQRRYGRQILLSTHSNELLRDEGIGLDEVLLFQPGEGTSVTPASSFEEVKALLQGGSPLADAVMPHTRPPKVEQLMLFGD